MNLTPIFILSLAMVFAPSTWARKQQLFVYESENFTDVGLVFNTMEADLTDHQTENFTYFCVVGQWSLYSTVNFTQNRAMWFAQEEQLCGTIDDPILSIRHGGASDTQTDALSLYARPQFVGDEIYIDDDSPIKAEISMPVQSIMSTGASNWTLFEGQLFDGNHTCWLGISPGAQPDSNGEMPTMNAEHNISLMPISNVGSLFKGCPEFIDEPVLEQKRKAWQQIKQQ